MPFEKGVDSVKRHLKNIEVGEVDQTHMTSTQGRRKPTAVHEQDVFLLQQLEHKFLVVFPPMRIGQADKHVEGSTRKFNLKAINRMNSLETVISLLLDLLHVGIHPSTVTVQAC